MGAKLEVIILGSMDKLSKTLKKADSETTKFGKALNTGSKIGGAALVALGAAAKVGFDEIRGAQAVTAQTTNALSKFGRTGQYTVQSIDAMAEAMMAKTGVDDEQIQSMANVLLANQAFRTGLGQTQEGLQRATTAAMDWSARTGKDGVSAMTLLNKSLANPIKGVSLLSRAGIRFTDVEKKQIETMVAHGRVADAQGVILSKLEGAFGGAAEAAGDAFDGKLNIAKESMRNLAGDVVKGVLPAFTSFVSMLTGAVSFLSRHSQATKIAAAVVGSLAAVVLTVNMAVKTWGAITAAATAVQSIFVTKTAIATVMTQQQAAAQVGLNYALSANPIGIVIIAIGALVAGFILAWQHSETFRNAVVATWNAIKSAAGAAADFITSTIPAAFSSVLNWVKGNWPKIATIISGPFAPLVALATNAFGVRSALISAFSSVRRFIGNVISNIVGWFTRLPGQLRSLASRAGSSFVSGISSGLQALGGALMRLVKAPINAVIRAWNGLGIPSFGVNIPMPGPVPDISFNTPGIPLPDIPQLAQGGIVTRPTLAMIGEGGSREAVIPLNRRSGGLGNTYHFHFPNYVGSKEELANVVRREFIKLGRRVPGALGGLA